MTDPASSVQKPITLPSDQDSTGRSLGREEIDLLSQAIESGRLFGPRGRFVKELEAAFAEAMSVEHAYACTSGTAAIHTAVAAIDPEPGDEVITTPITDMGALSPIPYQGAIPVFADVDPITCNVTAKTIADRISDKTKAIIVTHLFGSPCNMTEIMELADSRSIPVIEDCAQAFLAEHRGKRIGTFGSVSCFSLQQGKHITTGEGGLMVVNDPALARRAFLYINKAWGYGDEKPDHYFLALNYRMSELQGAVAMAQLPKLADGVKHRIDGARTLTEAIEDLPGITTPPVPDGDVHTFWRYSLHVDPDVIEGGCRGLAAALKDKGIFAGAGYIQKPSFMCEVFREQRTFGNSRWPFTLARPEAVDYDPAKFPGAFTGLDRILVFPWNERYDDQHVAFIADGIRSAVAELAR
jgi:dTDP-4-amino-4,6-dideoxygalactose transaminase